VSDNKDEIISALEARVAELERRAKPPAPIDLGKGGVSGPTTTQIAMSRLGMSPQVMRDHVAAVPSGVVRDVVGDGPVGKLAPAGAEGSARPSVAQQNTSGWRDAQKLEAPPGINHIDRLVEVQDARDRADLIAKEAQRLAKK
jgi:hypothetical protein